jgi:hypothetical protein
MMTDGSLMMVDGSPMLVDGSSITPLAEHPTIDIRAMGFPANWQDEPLWQ